jgi:chromosome segregation ATPase
MLNMVASPSVGHNKPPGPIELARVTIDAMSEFMKDNPVIDSEDTAREAKLLCDRAKAALDEIEAERDKSVRPLNEQVSAINAKYKALHNTDSKKPGTYDRIFTELKARLSAFLIKQEEIKRKEAERAAAEAAEAERLAREAEQRELEAKANAKVGEVDVDVVAATEEADATFAQFEQASRFAARAERDTKVKVGGGFGKAAALRKVETLHLENYGRAIKAIGPHPKIEEGILAAAREYRKDHGQLPDGVTATTERKL